jgi:hypothetical protein
MTYVIFSQNLIEGTLRAEQNKRGKGSHEIVHNTFEIAYAKAVPQNEFRDFKEWFGQLEQKRIESDYFETEIDEPASSICFDLTNRVLLQLKSKYK